MLDHHHQCIFVHIPKCGGSSIEHVFLQLVGLDWRRRAPLLLQANDIATLGPPRLAHLRAEEYVKYKYTPQAMFDQYFKFTFVRNPWARAVSIFHNTAFNLYPDFPTYVKDRYTNKDWKASNWFSKPQVSFFMDDNGKPLVDFVGRLESINQDFEHISQQLKLGALEVPHNNKTRKESYRTVVDGALDGRDFRQFYDDESLAIISDYYRDDIKVLDYQF